MSFISQSPYVARRKTPAPTPVQVVPRPTVTKQLVQNVPGVNPSGASRPITVSQQTAPENSIQDLTPLERYQQGIRNKLERTTQFTNQATALQAKRAKFATKQTNLKQPAGKAYGGGPLRGAWGGFQNGRIPTNALAQIAPGHYLRADAARAFASMNAAFARQFGRSISITDSYRSLANQVTLARTKPGLAATPGTSNHGWGLALDLGGGINRWGTAENNWMHQNAARFGFAPLSGRMGQKEPWHWEYRG